MIEWFCGATFGACAYCVLARAEKAEARVAELEAGVQRLRNVLCDIAFARRDDEEDLKEYSRRLRRTANNALLEEPEPGVDSVSTGQKTSEGVAASAGERASHEPALSLADRGSEESAPLGGCSSEAPKRGPKSDCDNCHGTGKWTDIVWDEEHECPCVGGLAMKAPRTTEATPMWLASTDIGDRTTVERAIVPPERKNGKTYTADVICEALPTEGRYGELPRNSLQNAAIIARALNDAASPRPDYPRPDFVKAAEDWLDEWVSDVHDNLVAPLAEELHDAYNAGARLRAETAVNRATALLRGYNRLVTIADPTSEEAPYTVSMVELADWIEAMLAAPETGSDANG